MSRVIPRGGWLRGHHSFFACLCGMALPLLHSGLVCALLSSAHHLSLHRATRPISSGRALPSLLANTTSASPYGLPEEGNPFTTPGSPYEVDVGEIKELLGHWEAANRRWALETASSKQGGVLDDRGSMLHKWWHDPVSGPRAAAARREVVVARKRQLNRVLRPALLGAGCALGLRAPVGVAQASARYGLAVHVGVPLARLVAAKIATVASRTRRRASGRPAGALPVADAGLLLATQYPVSYTHLTLPTICSV